MDNFLNEYLSPGTRVLVTGGGGFIGGCLVRRLLTKSNAQVFNLDKCGYASDFTSIEEIDYGHRHHLFRVDLVDGDSTTAAIKKADPDLVFHLAAETHVDRSIDGPNAFVFSNVIGTYNLLEGVRTHWQSLPKQRKELFRFHHISTDEVFGSLGDSGSFTELTRYAPRSPYAATKASSDHLVSAWHHTFGLPIVLTNCSNNFGPWQFPEKLIPLVITKAMTGQSIPLYGDGSNVRDWLFVEDHVDALLLAAIKGRLGQSYCIGGFGERSNKQVVELLCELMDERQPELAPHTDLIKLVSDRPGHDHRYSIDSVCIQEELGWKPQHTFELGLASTLDWYLAHIPWCEKVLNRAGYAGERIGA